METFADSEKARSVKTRNSAEFSSKPFPLNSLEADLKFYFNFTPQSSLRLALVGCLNLQLHKFHCKRLALQIQARHSDGQLKPARAGASWIDVEHAITFKFSRLMGMPANNDVETGGRRVQVEGVHVVKNVEEDFARFRHRRFGQRPGPIGGVHVSAHGNDRSEFPQRSEDFRLAYITGMKNQLRTTKRLERLRTQ